MSIDSAKAYVERMKCDEEFRKKVLECTDPQKRMELVKDEGFDFTQADIQVVVAVVDDAYLGGVRGGSWFVDQWAKITHPDTWDVNKPDFKPPSGCA